LLAIRSGHVEVARLLHGTGADIDAPNASGLTALAESAQEGLLEVVRLFLYQGANIQATCKRGRTPLIWDVISDVVALLLEHGANIESRCIDGNTPLLNAVSIPSHGSYDGIVRLLLENNADVHALNNDRWTPL
ncbi:ankyrin repeat protein, partial [Pyronema domesticum]